MTMWVAASIGGIDSDAYTAIVEHFKKRNIVIEYESDMQVLVGPTANVTT